MIIVWSGRSKEKIKVITEKYGTLWAHNKNSTCGSSSSFAVCALHIWTQNVKEISSTTVAAPMMMMLSYIVLIVGTFLHINEWRLFLSPNLIAIFFLLIVHCQNNSTCNSSPFLVWPIGLCRWCIN